MAKKRSSVLKLFYFVPPILALLVYFMIGFFTSFPSVKVILGLVCFAAAFAMIVTFWRRWWGYLPMLLLIAWMVLIERHMIVLVLLLLVLCGLQLANHRWWGCLPSMALGAALLVYGFHQHGQAVPEWPLGVALLLYYLLCGIAARRKRKKLKED